MWLQSFNKDDVLYWVTNAPEFGKQAVYLDSVDPTADPPVPRLTLDELKQLRAQGVRYFAPPMPALLEVNANNEVVPSKYALDIRSVGFKIITWTFERSDLRKGASQAGFYYYFDPRDKAIKKDSDMYKALDTLAKQVKVVGIFSDWPATVTCYANEASASDRRDVCRESGAWYIMEGEAPVDGKELQAVLANDVGRRGGDRSLGIGVEPEPT